MAKRTAEPGDNKLPPKAKLNLTNLKKSLRLFKYIGHQRWKLVLGIFFLMGTASVGLIFPMFGGKMFGYFGADKKPLEQMDTDLNQTGLIMLLVLVLQAFFSFGRVYMFTQITESILKGLRSDTFRRLIQMPMSFFSQNQVNELGSRLATDINVISEAFTTNIAEVVRQTIVGLGGMVMLIVLTPPKIWLWFIMIIPPIVLIAILFGKKIRRFSKDLQTKIAESNVVVGEALTGIGNVKSFTNEPHEISRYEKVTSDIRSFALKYGIYRGTFFAFVISCIFGSIFFILYIMLYMKNHGDLKPEQFGTFMMYSIFVAASLGGLADQIASVQRALGATDRVFELIDGDIESIDLKHEQLTERRKGKIEFRDVDFSYPSRKDYQVLHKVSFTAAPGQTVALVGPSGSGKSTVASMIMRFYDPNSGQILIDDKNSMDYSLTELRDNMAIVPQDVILFGGTIRENIAYGKTNATMEEIIDAAKKANAFDFIDSFPDKFETLVGDRGIQLSGGQRQRIAIARAVLKDPAILILDEATSSLDSASERLVQEALDKLMQGRTSVVIAHRLSTIRKADKIVVLEKGVVKEEGTHDQLSNIEQGLYQKLSRMQFELNA